MVESRKSRLDFVWEYRSEIMSSLKDDQILKYCSNLIGDFKDLLQNQIMRK